MKKISVNLAVTVYFLLITGLAWAVSSCKTEMQLCDAYGKNAGKTVKVNKTKR